MGVVYLGSFVGRLVGLQIFLKNYTNGPSSISAVDELVFFNDRHADGPIGPIYKVSLSES